MTDDYDQLEMFPVPPPTNPLREGFKCVYGGWTNHDSTRYQFYVAIFADHATYTSDHPNWLEEVTANIAQQVTRPMCYLLHIYDRATAKTLPQGTITTNL